jgi:hypothetical protein
MMLAAIFAMVMPFLNEADLKEYYDATSVYAIYNTRSADKYTKTQNPLAAVMGICKHYGKLPQSVTKSSKGKLDSDKEWIRELNKVTKLAGLRDNDFGNIGKWKSNLGKTLKFQDVRRDVVEVENNLTFVKEEKHLKEWLEKKMPVMWVREATGDEQDDENRRINGGKPFPLTIALIDGVNDNGEYHVVWPRGNDRRYKHIKSGWHNVSNLFYDVNRSVLIYWRP